MRSRLDAAVAAALALAAFAVYVRTLAPSVLPGDSGEFQFAAYSWALPIPPAIPFTFSSASSSRSSCPWATSPTA